MQVYKAVLHGQNVEFRRGDWGGEMVLLNGRPVSHRPLAGWWATRPHFFQMRDEHERERQVEVRLMDMSTLGLGRYRCVMLVDGQERCRVDPDDRNSKPNVCSNCGYLLRGLPVENGEIRCPECGRHTTAPFE